MLIGTRRSAPAGAARDANNDPAARVQWSSHASRSTANRCGLRGCSPLGRSQAVPIVLAVHYACTTLVVHQSKRNAGPARFLNPMRKSLRSGQAGGVKWASCDQCAGRSDRRSSSRAGGSAVRDICRVRGEPRSDCGEWVSHSPHVECLIRPANETPARRSNR